MAITLPLIILLYDLTFRGIKARLPSVKHAINTAKDRWRYYLGYAVTGSVYLVLRFYIIIDPADGVKPNFGNLFERLAYLPNHLFSFIKLALAPYNLNVEYVFSYPQNFFEISHLVGFATTLMLAICSFFIYRRFKTIFFGIWWFLITLLPVCNIIEIFNPFAERYLYLPIIGFCLALPMLLYSIFSRATNRAVAANLATLLVVLVITGIYSTITVARNRDWKDGLTLWSKTVKQSPNSGIAHGSLGRAYQEQGLLDKAIAEYRKTVMIMPNNFKAYYNLGVAYDQKGDINKAVENLKRSITINPAFADAHFNLANLYNKRGLTDEAIHHYRKAIDLNPNDIEARNNLGVTLALQGKVKKAIIEWQKVLEIDPANKSAQDNIAQARELLEQSD
jgi:tetratricopeptide (TPR) repeat protein